MIINKENWIQELQNQKQLLLAIDGMSASGKTTLASELHHLLGGNLFHMDDFFLPMEKRTPERLTTPGGNVDYERFLETVLKPLSLKQDVVYQPFDCMTMTFKEPQIIKYHPINIIEGSYALHPVLKDYYSHTIVLSITQITQKQRIEKRNPKNYDMFFNKWIPLENEYFEYYKLYQTEKVLKMD